MSAGQGPVLSNQNDWSEVGAVYFLLSSNNKKNKEKENASHISGVVHQQPCVHVDGAQAK